MLHTFGNDEHEAAEDAARGASARGPHFSASFIPSCEAVKPRRS